MVSCSVGAAVGSADQRGRSERAAARSCPGLSVPALAPHPSLRQTGLCPKGPWQQAQDRPPPPHPSHLPTPATSPWGSPRLSKEDTAGHRDMRPGLLHVPPVPQRAWRPEAWALLQGGQEMGEACGRGRGQERCQPPAQDCVWETLGGAAHAGPAYRGENSFRTNPGRRPQAGPVWSAAHSPRGWG